MQGFRFYLEYSSPSKKRQDTYAHAWETLSEGNVIAMSTDAYGEGFASVYSFPNCDVNWGGIERGYLRAYCRRIPESLAREIHPRLFARLDANHD